MEGYGNFLDHVFLFLGYRTVWLGPLQKVTHSSSPSSFDGRLGSLFCHLGRDASEWAIGHGQKVAAAVFCFLLAWSLFPHAYTLSRKYLLASSCEAFGQIIIIYH